VLLAFLVRRNTCGLDLLTTFALDLFHLYFVLKGIKHPIFPSLNAGEGGRAGASQKIASRLDFAFYFFEVTILENKNKKTFCLLWRLEKMLSLLSRPPRFLLFLSITYF
jgi:hypothetical protein